MRHLALLVAFLALPLAAQSPSHSGGEPPLYQDEVVEHLLCQLNVGGPEAVAAGAPFVPYHFEANFYGGSVGACVARPMYTIQPHGPESPPYYALDHYVIVELVPPSGVPSFAARIKAFGPNAKQRGCVLDFRRDPTLPGASCERHWQIPVGCNEWLPYHVIVPSVVGADGLRRDLAVIETMRLMSPWDVIRYCTPAPLVEAEQSTPPGGDAVTVPPPAPAPVTSFPPR